MSQAGAQAACDLSLSSGWGHVTAAPRLQIQLQEEAAYGPGPGGEGTRPPGPLLAWAREAKPGPLPFQPPAVTLAQLLKLSEPPHPELCCRVFNSSCPQVRCEEEMGGSMSSLRPALTHRGD